VSAEIASVAAAAITAVLSGDVAEALNQVGTLPIRDRLAVRHAAAHLAEVLPSTNRCPADDQYVSHLDGRLVVAGAGSQWQQRWHVDCLVRRHLAEMGASR